MVRDVLVLKGACSGCGTTVELWASSCRHITLCQPCGKSKVESGANCFECGVSITRLVREYNVKPVSVNKQYIIGRFLQGLPSFSKEKLAETRWSMQREGVQGRQLNEALREKYKGKPWILEDDIGQQQFTGQLEGGQQATYYLLMVQGQDFIAVPAGNWYNFHKVAHYKQLTLEEAEEQMKNRRKTADGYQRWMMKAANTGAAAFGGDVEKVGGSGGSGGRKKGGDDDDNDADSDKAEEDEEEEEARINRLGTKKGSGGGEEDGEEPAQDLDLDDEEPEKGDDWEHEETFTDDDEAVGNDPEERDDHAPEQPPPPEIKQEEEDEENQEGQQEEGGGLSKSGKELKKLLGKSGLDNESDGEEDEEEDEDVDLDNDIGLSPVLAPTRKDGPKEEQADASQAKPAPLAKSAQLSSAASKKRKSTASDDAKPNGTGTAKKVKSESTKTPVSAKKEVTSAPKAVPTSATAKNSAVAGSGTTPAVNAAVTEEEVAKVLRQTGPIKSTDLVARFRSRLKTVEDKSAFAAILKKISRIQKTDGANYIVLRDK